MVTRQDELRERSLVAEEKRLWVRLTYACNNRCVFCLDGGRKERTHRTSSEIERRIKEGRAQGFTRLILSGGEPTIHPGFLDFTALGRELGYQRIQVISNGRMFAYPGFASKAIRAGLDEATISIHGHDSSLHDELVGVKGAFEQSLAGIVNLLEQGACHVSVDVVVNRRNVMYLGKILEKMQAIGVHEFDILKVMPFGRGNDPGILFEPGDPRGAVSSVRQALSQSMNPGVYLWTNRFPAPWLEGIEHLVQDPHKIWDEVRGRRAELEEWASVGNPLSCRDGRCRYCFMQGLCEHIEQAWSVIHGSPADLVLVDLDELGPGQSAERAGALKGTGSMRIQASDPLDLVSFFSRLDEKPNRVELDLPGKQGKEPVRNFYEALQESGVREQCLLFHDLEALEEFKSAAHGRIELMLELNRKVIESLPKWGTWPGNVRPFIEYRAEVGQVLDMDIDMDMSGLAIENLTGVRGAPFCLGGSDDKVRTEIDLASIVINGRDSKACLDLDRVVEHYIGRLYREKSFRCSSCPEEESCPGLHINYVRAFGLGALTPVLSGEEPQPNSGLCDYSIMEDGRARLVIKNPCRNSCSFCTTMIVNREAGRALQTDALEKIIATLGVIRKQGLENLDIVAYEILDHPNWPSVLSHAADMGFSDIAVWTHARPLADPIAAMALSKSIVSRVNVTVLGPDKEVHDKVAGQKGAFDETLKGLENMQELGMVEIFLSSVIVRDNVSRLADTVNACITRIPGRLDSLVVAEPSTHDIETYMEIAFPFSDLEKVIRTAPLDIGREMVGKLFGQVPTCVLFRALEMETTRLVREVEKPVLKLAEIGEARGTEFKKRKVCPLAGSCGFASVCPGLFGQYLSVFGTAGLEPR